MGTVTQEQDLSITIDSSVKRPLSALNSGQKLKSNIRYYCEINRELIRKKPQHFSMIIPTTGLTPSLSKSRDSRSERGMEQGDQVTRNSSCKEWLSRLGLLTDKKSTAHGVQERKGIWWECPIPLIAWREGIEINFSSPLPAQELGATEWSKEGGSSQVTPYWRIEVHNFQESRRDWTSPWKTTPRGAAKQTTTTSGNPKQ